MTKGLGTDWNSNGPANIAAHAEERASNSNERTLAAAASPAGQVDLVSAPGETSSTLSTRRSRPLTLRGLSVRPKRLLYPSPYHRPCDMFVLTYKTACHSVLVPRISQITYALLEEELGDDGIMSRLVSHPANIGHRCAYALDIHLILQ